jgi:hypothetical protein
VDPFAVNQQGVSMQIGTLTWDVEALAEQLHLTVDETLEYFKDGRRGSFVVERRIAREIIGGKISESEGSSFDVYDSEGNKWEVRSLTKGGMYFCPSYMVGAGRKFDEAGFQTKLDEIKGYYVARITTFPEVEVFKIDVEQVRKWHKNKELGPSTKISKPKMEELLKTIA